MFCSSGRVRKEVGGRRWGVSGGGAVIDWGRVGGGSFGGGRKNSLFSDSLLSCREAG